MIGNVIRRQRDLKKLSRSKLADGICSEKYIYLIETNQRNPSAYMMSEFSERLGIDLFEYYQYPSYDDKILVVQYKKSFEKFIQKGDFRGLFELALEAEKLEDFKREPLIHQIKIIKLSYTAFTNPDKSEEVINIVSKILEDDSLNIDELTLIYAHTLLSSLYQLENKIIEAEKILKSGYKLIHNKKHLLMYRTSIISLLISYSSFLYRIKDYDSLMEISYELINYQESIGDYNRIYYPEFFLSFSYFYLKDIEKCKYFYRKALYSSLYFNNYFDMKIIREMEDFIKISEFLEADKNYINLFINS